MNTTTQQTRTPGADLFPETLLVVRHGERIYATSPKVAEYAKKRHADVLRAIENKLKELPAGFAERNFAFSSYTDSTGRSLPMYEMTEEGFALTMMGFTGKEAVQWQVDFIEAFTEMRRQLHAQRDRYVAALDVLCPSLRPTVEGTVAGQDRTTIATAIGKTCASVTYYRGKSRRLNLLPGFSRRNFELATPGEQAQRSHHMTLAEGGAA